MGPPSLGRVLVGCDINKNIQIEDIAQLTSINIQIKSIIRVFRTYVKLMEDKTYYRVEKLLTPNKPNRRSFREFES